MKKINIKIADYFIVGFILALGLAGLWFNVQGAGATAGSQKYAVIYLENEVVAELSLSPGDSFAYTFNFGEGKEHTAEVEIEDRMIRMLPMGEDLCPRGICSHTGWIEHSYEHIVCLPNQIKISFVEGAADLDGRDLDGVTY